MLDKEEFKNVERDIKEIVDSLDESLLSVDQHDVEVEDTVTEIEERGAEPVREDHKIEVKRFEFDITETKEIERNGQRYGLVVGYASTFLNVDRGRDKVMPGAFKRTIARHQAKNRPVRMYYQHDNKEIIGGFSAFKMREDTKGLYVEGEINLQVQKGREVYSLAQQGVLTDFSIGYSVVDFDISDGVRELKEVELWEVSVVSEPMNPEANITEVKQSLTTKRDVERYLRDLGASRSCATYIASSVDETKLYKDSTLDEVSSQEEQADLKSSEESSEALEKQVIVNDLLRQALEHINYLKGK